MASVIRRVRPGCFVSSYQSFVWSAFGDLCASGARLSAGRGAATHVSTAGAERGSKAPAATLSRSTTTSSSSSSSSSSTGASAAAGSPTPPSLLDSCARLSRLLEGAPRTAAVDTEGRKRCQAAFGAVTSAIADPEQVGELTVSMLLIVLPLLVKHAQLHMREERREFERQLLRASGASGAAAVLRESPFFDGAVVDVLNAWIASCAPSLSHGDTYELLACMTALHLGDSAQLSAMIRRLGSKSGAAALSDEQRADVVHFASLAAARHQVQVLGLAFLLQPLHEPTSRISSGATLRLLSAFARLRERRYSDTIRLISRREAERGIEHYSFRDLCFAMQAATLLPNISEQYVIALLQLAPELVAAFGPRDLGSLCKALSHLRTRGHTHSIVSNQCASEVRRLLAQIVEVAEKHVGRFSVRDARCVLQCLKDFGVRHGMLFARLTNI